VFVVAILALKRYYEPQTIFMSNIQPQNLHLFLAALILAGGQSSRMGKDKALILWDGIPLLERVCQVASSCTEQVYILTPWPERYQDSLKDDNYRLLAESNPGQGPLVALSQGLAEIPADWILLLACDMPQLQIEIIQNWVNELAQLPASILAMVPRQNNLWQPMCGFYRREALTQLHSFIRQEGRSFQTWLEQIPVQAIAVNQQASDMLFNCNTPLDLRGKGE
jgi:molybdenum cofactor guanylyltransferase